MFLKMMMQASNHEQAAAMFQLYRKEFQAMHESWLGFGVNEERRKFLDVMFQF